MPINEVKKQFSESLFKTLCAHSKYLCQQPTVDYGVDFTIEQLYTDESGSAFASAGELLSIQVKSTKNWERKDNHIKYKLSNKVYNMMVFRNQHKFNPIILILCCLPEKHEDWLEYQEYTTLFTNCYWFITEDNQLKENQKSKTIIHIPLEQRFKKNTITELIEKYNIKPMMNQVNE